jgi:hypothetical protein
MSKTTSQITNALRPIVSNENEQLHEYPADKSTGVSADELKTAVKEGVREGFEAYQGSESESEQSSSNSEESTGSSSRSSSRRVLTLVVFATVAYLLKRRRRSSDTNDSDDVSQAS